MIHDKALNWLFNGEVGISSQTMCAAALGIDFKGHDMPHDADDFSRCYKFIKLFDEAEQLQILDMVAQTSDEWKMIVKSWDVLVSHYESKEYHALYEALSNIRGAYRKPRPNEIFIKI